MSENNHIKLPYSEVKGHKPDQTRLHVGELWINGADNIIGTKKNDGSIVEFAQWTTDEKTKILSADYIPKSGVVSDIAVSQRLTIQQSNVITINDDSNIAISYTAGASDTITIDINHTTGNKATQLTISKPSGVTCTITWNGVDQWLSTADQPVFGVSEDQQEISVAIFTSPTRNCVNVIYNTENQETSEVVAIWGSISGTLSDQSDLMSVLNSKASATALNDYLLKSGGSITGSLTIQDPTTDTNPATKKYVDDAVKSATPNLANYKGDIGLRTLGSDGSKSAITTLVQPGTTTVSILANSGTSTGEVDVSSTSATMSVINGSAKSVVDVDQSTVTITGGSSSIVVDGTSGITLNGTNVNQLVKTTDLTSYARLDGADFTGDVTADSLTVTNTINGTAQSAINDKDGHDITTTYLKKSDSYMFGTVTVTNKLTVPSPSATTDAATKQYVDNSISSLNISQYATTTALSSGLSGKAPVNHTHSISDVTNLQTTLDEKATKSQLANFVPISGGSFTGNITVPAPTANNHPATKQYVDSAVASVYKYKGSVASQSKLPSSGNIAGDVWNVEDTGVNYAWTGTAWDSLAGTVDLSGYLTKANPTSSGVWTHQGNGQGNTDVVLKIQSNNGVLTGYGDTSSNFHIGGVAVVFDNIAQFPQGFTFPTYDGDLTGNATNLKNFSTGEFRAKAVNYVATGCDYNGYPSVDSQNFLVFNQNIDGGNHDNWSYQAFKWNDSTSEWDRVFGVKADGSIITNDINITEKVPALENQVNSLGSTYATISLVNTKANTSDVVNLTSNQTIGGTKTFTSSITGSLNGNASTATRLATSRNIAVSGAVTGTGSFNGSANVTIATTLTPMTGATSSGGGSTGGVPAPAAGQDQYYLRGDGTWQPVSAIDFAVCSTAAATAAKTVSISGFTRKTGSRITVMFTNGSTVGDPTLNVTGTGAAAIRYLGANLIANDILGGAVIDFVFDGTYWQVVGALPNERSYTTTESDNRYALKSNPVVIGTLTIN